MLIARSPRLDVATTDSAAGRLLRDHFGARAFGLVPHNCLCRGVLILPRAHEDYLRGRRRQAVRTNLRRAKAAGIRCETVGSARCALTAVHQVVIGRHPTPTGEDLACLTTQWPKLLEDPASTVVVARGAAGPALALCAVLIDDDVAMIRLAVASSHEARWCLHGYLVQILISRGVRCLLSDGDGPFGALGYSPSVQYYQRLLGYELRHITMRDARRTPDRVPAPHHAGRSDAMPIGP